MTIEQEIIMEALKLCKSYLRWKTGVGSVKSFSGAKDKFCKLLREDLIFAEKVGIEKAGENEYSVRTKPLPELARDILEEVGLDRRTAIDNIQYTLGWNMAICQIEKLKFKLIKKLKKKYYG